MRKLIRIGVLVFVVCSSVLFAQESKTDDAAKEKQRRREMILGQVLAEIPDLKLGENRAFVYAKVGNMTWESDKNQATAYFQNAASELAAAQAALDSDKKTNPTQNLLVGGGNARNQILNLVAARNAELALDLLIKTRPAIVAKAMASYGIKTTKIGNGQSLASIAQSEFQLEQSFIRMAADQNPDRAVKILKDAIAKSVTHETLGLLKKLAEKDAAAANSLTSSVIDRLMKEDLTIDGQANYQTLQVCSTLLSDYLNAQPGNKRVLKFDDAQIRRLSERLFTYYLDQAAQNGYVDFGIVGIAEKLAPNIVDQLKKAVRGGGRWGDMGGYDPDLQKLMSGETTAEQMIAAAKNYPVNAQRQLYQSAASRLARDGNYSGASALLNDKFSAEARDEMLRNVNWQYMNTLMSKGSFQEAERLIDEMPENVRGGALVQLANSIYQKNPVDNRTYAMAVLLKARSLTSDKPENTQEMSSLSQVIGAYATMEPAEAFRMYEPLLPIMNELTDAAAVINGFQNNYNVRNREYLLTNGMSFGFYGADYSVFWILAKNDFDRTMALIDSFSHREVRISLKIQMVESGLN